MQISLRRWTNLYVFLKSSTRTASLHLAMLLLVFLLGEDALFDLVSQLLLHDRRSTGDELLEEALHEHHACLGRVVPAGQQVEELALVDAAGGGAVAALHVVGVDLQARYGVRSRAVIEDEVVVGQVGVGLRRVWIDLDEALIYASSFVLHGALVEGPAAGVVSPV